MSQGGSSLDRLGEESGGVWDKRGVFKGLRMEKRKGYG